MINNPPLKKIQKIWFSVYFLTKSNFRAIFGWGGLLITIGGYIIVMQRYKYDMKIPLIAYCRDRHNRSALIIVPAGLFNSNHCLWPRMALNFATAFRNDCEGLDSRRLLIALLIALYWK